MQEKKRELLIAEFYLIVGCDRCCFYVIVVRERNKLRAVENEKSIIFLQQLFCALLLRFVA